MAKDSRLFGKFGLDFPDHPKILPLSDAAFRCLVEATLWSRKQMTDGMLARRYAVAKWGPDVLAELATNDPESPSLIESEEGWMIHDFAEHQETRADIEARSERNKAAGRRGGLAKAKRSAKRVASKSLSESLPETETETETEERGHVRGNVTSSATTVAWPSDQYRCEKHRDDPRPPSCGACAAVRRAAEAEAKDAESDRLNADRTEAARVAAERHRQAEAEREAVARCSFCDDVGMRLDRAEWCDHRPSRAADTAKRGLALARQALEGDNE